MRNGSKPPGPFEDVAITWRGREYRIAAHRVFGAIQRIEDVVTMEELRRYAMRETVPLAKLADAYAAVLRYAGARNVDGQEVYSEMFGDDEKLQEQIIQSVMGIVNLMLPLNARRKMQAALAGEQGEVDPAAGEAERREPESATVSSLEPTRPRSDDGG